MKSDILMCVGGPLAGKLYQVAEDQDYIEGLIPESAPALDPSFISDDPDAEVSVKRVLYRRTRLVDANGKRLEALFEAGCANPLETLLKDYHDQILQKEALETTLDDFGDENPSSAKSRIAELESQLEELNANFDTYINRNVAERYRKDVASNALVERCAALEAELAALRQAQPEEMTYEQAEELSGNKYCSESWADGWNACRAAMLAQKGPAK